VLAALHLFTRGRREWRDHPGIESAVWFGIGLALLVTVVAIGSSYDGRGLEALAWALERTLLVPGLLWLPVLLVGGIEIVDLGLGTGRAATRFLDRVVPAWANRALGWLVPIAGVVAWVAAGLNDRLPLFSWGPNRSAADLAWLLVVAVFGFGPPTATTIWVVVRRLRRSWDRQADAIGITLGIACLILLFVHVVAFEDQVDPVEWAIIQAVVASGIFVPYTVTVLLLIHNVATFGARYANREGRLLIRQGRVLMHFGVLLLMLACGIFFADHYIGPWAVERRFEPVLQVGLLLGVGVVAPLYLFWIVVRRQDRILGSTTERS
jgi:hypothetical protein